MTPRPAHRKRGSVLALSSDTTHSLPVYVADADDRPPDYPDSADEADGESDPSDASVYVPPPPPTSSPPRRRHTPSAQHQTHRRRQSRKSNPTDPCLDSLLARSVHALEVSNTLLQSSISTQTALSTIFAHSPADEVLENSVRGLSMRIERRDAQPQWADDLAEISRGVEGLFAEEQVPSNVSCSLPTGSGAIRQPHRHTRRPSLLELGSRPDLVAPPPRALTQYAGSNPAIASSLDLPLHAPLSLPKITETLPEPATPAYNMLSPFVAQRSPSASTSPSSTPPALPNFFSNISRRKPTINQTSTSPPTPFKPKSLSTTRASSPSSLTLTPKQILPRHRHITPPAEEPGSSSSSSSDGGYIAKRTVLSLRRILDEQPAPQPKPTRRLRAPAFLPRTPAPVAEAGTSTATASISRLYTKGKHTSSTRPPSPPRQSAMKQRQQQSRPSTPTSASTPNSHSKPSPPMVFRFPDVFGMRSWSSASLRSLGGVGDGRGAPTPSSGRSTPKRISFAQLPESYRGSTSARFERGRRKRGKGKGRALGGGSGSEAEAEGAWWGAWFLGAGGGGREERIEERLGRSWGGRMPGAPAGFGPGADEWAI